jgi:hypothetical protein
MSWNFRIKVGNMDACVPKHPNQILQEAASVISLGGGFQNYIMQGRDGAPNMNAIRKMTALSDFMRERQEFCFKGKPVHQAAMLLSTYDRAHEVAARVYSRDGYEKQMGMTALLCDAGQSTEIVFEHDLKDHYSDYPMIIIPELCHSLEESTAKELIDYAANGGSLVLAGKRTCEFFANAGLPFSVVKLDKYKNSGEDQKDNGHGIINNTLLPYKLFLDNDTSAGALVDPCGIEAKDAIVLASTLSDGVKMPLSVIFNYKKGKIALIGFDIGSQYLSYRQYLHRSLIKKIAELSYEPVARIESSRGNSEIVCLEKNGKLMLQIINANGSHADPTSMSEDDIPPLVDTVLSVATANKNASVTLQPEGRKLNTKQKDGRIYFSIDRTDIHNVAEISEI